MKQIDRKAGASFRREQRREGARRRFKIQTETQFNNGQKGDRNVGSYADYVAHKNVEAQALGLSKKEIAA